MKGPQIEYYCNGCDNLISYMFFCTCNEDKDNKPINDGSVTGDGTYGKFPTPNWCPYLLKIDRTIKINRLNENR